MALLNNGLTGCCGIQIIWDFESCDDTEETMKRVSELKKYWKPRIGLLLVTLASYQWRQYHGRLIKAGFIRYQEFHNPNSGNRVRLYGWSTKQRERKNLW